jgi:hypothetical protein
VRVGEVRPGAWLASYAPGELFLGWLAFGGGYGGYGHGVAGFVGVGDDAELAGAVDGDVLAVYVGGPVVAGACVAGAALEEVEGAGSLLLASRARARATVRWFRHQPGIRRG